MREEREKEILCPFPSHTCSLRVVFPIIPGADDTRRSCSRNPSSPPFLQFHEIWGRIGEAKDLFSILPAVAFALSLVHTHLKCMTG